MSEIERTAAELFCNFNIWPYGLECHVFRYALEQYAQSLTPSTYPFRKCNDFSMLIRYVTLWPWPLTLYVEHMWYNLVDRVSCQIWARSINPRLSYWWFTTDLSSVFRSAPKPEWVFWKGRGPICTKFGQDITRSLCTHWCMRTS